MGSLTNRSRGPRRRGRGATAALPPPAPSPDEVRGVRGRGAGRGEGGGQRGGRRGAGAAPAGLAPSPAPGQGVTASVGLSAAAAARGSAVQSSARGAAGAAASATDAPGEPDGRAAKRRSWLGCVGGGTTRAHLLAAARARKGDRDLTLTLATCKKKKCDFKIAIRTQTTRSSLCELPCCAHYRSASSHCLLRSEGGSSASRLQLPRGTETMESKNHR
ncbi:uncharacterized protein [Manis javanica]|uniref:uncharacterized protein isoform X2 n=1 Tax=Manis javanica TaxID=9974 RepID=UPI003C6D006E